MAPKIVAYAFIKELTITEFWAVEYVSYELKKDDVLCLIGNNDSGKSTLLMMLNGIYMRNNIFANDKLIKYYDYEEMRLEDTYDKNQYVRKNYSFH